jgi:tRNA(Arg) A34 adenosine deaminase TadA
VSPSTADEAHLRRAIELARLSRERNNHPFGSLLVDRDGNIVLEAENTVVTERDVTGHAELNVVRAASTRLDAAALGSHTLYTSTEPCAMCAGAVFWSGIGRVVFALSSTTFLAKMKAEGGASLEISCRDIFSHGGRTIEVSGPHLEDEAWETHEGFWPPAASH